MSLIFFLRIFLCLYGLVTMGLLWRVIALLATHKDENEYADWYFLVVVLWPLYVFTEVGRDTLSKVLEEKKAPPKKPTKPTGDKK